MATTGVLATTVELPTYVNPVQRTVSASNQISQGTLLVLTDPNTAVASATTSVGLPWGGVAAAEKSILDGDTSTSLAAHTSGKFKFTCSGAVTVGQKVMISGANMVGASTEAAEISGASIGVAEETAVDQETPVVRLRGY